MSSPDFDHTRMQMVVGCDLNKPQHAAAFMSIIQDYMDHARSLSDCQGGQDEDREKETAQMFLHLINNDVAWPLARISVPEFRKTIDYSILPQPLRYILESVSHRLPKSEVVPRAVRVQSYQEQLQWRKFQAQVDVLAHAVGGYMERTEGKSQEVQVVENKLQGVVTKVKSMKPQATDESQE